MLIPKMRLDIIDYLKDPQLVASIQQFFGIKIYYDKHFEELRSNSIESSQNDKNESIYTEIDHNKENFFICDQKINRYDINNIRYNGYMKSIEQQKKSVNKYEERASTNSTNLHYIITNSFWYYLFLFGTQLGDEIFYSAFIPFWFWNIDGTVGRRVVLVWAIVMSVGQVLKDVICWPRPACPPAVRLQSKWSQEYGMPSTHAMISVSIPFSILLYTMNRYVYPVSFGCIIAILWCILVSTSRLYLGMHTVLDIVVGIILAIVLMIPLVPLVDVTNSYIVTNFWLLAILIIISITVIIYYPCNDKWTPTRGDTTMVVSVTAGVHTGTWLNHYTGVLNKPLSLPPYHITWPTYSMFGRLVCRNVLGFFSIIVTKILCKSLTYITLCAILRINSKELMKCKDHSGNQNKIFVDLVYKYITCFMIGVNTVYLLPNVFDMIGIDRPMFYTEL